MLIKAVKHSNKIFYVDDTKKIITLSMQMFTMKICTMEGFSTEILSKLVRITFFFIFYGSHPVVFYSTIIY
jgi:hypothetical protein